MADRYTSRLALVVTDEVDVGKVVAAAIDAGDIDRTRPLEPGAAAEVHWGGRMAKAVVRRLVEDGRHLLRAEAWVGGDGLVTGMRRQAQLLQGLARQVRGQVEAVADMSARREHDLGWMNRLAVGAVAQDDVIVADHQGDGTHWVATHGAARFDVPDLEFYGLRRDQVDAAVAAAAHLHAQLLDDGLRGAELALPSGTPVYLVPVLEAWQELPMDWPGIGRGGANRGPGLDGPRATVSLLSRRRLGRWKTDMQGVVDLL